MKKFLLLIVIILHVAVFAGHAYEPVLQDGRSWVYTCKWYDHKSLREVVEYQQWVVVGDTTVFEFPCKKIVRTPLTSAPTDISSPIHARYACEEDGRVYLIDGEDPGMIDWYVEHPEEYWSGAIRKWLLFDFNLSVGDEFLSNVYFVKFVVTDKDEIEVDGRKRTRLTLTNNGCHTSYWVEGIGSMDDTYIEMPLDCIAGLPEKRVSRAKSDLDYRTHIEECRMDGDIIFQLNNFVNPDAPFQVYDYTAVKEIPASSPGLDPGVLYDLQGSKVSNPQRGSIYIKNGRKIVWK